MKTIQVPVGQMGNLSYILYDDNNNAAIIDLSWESDKILNIVRQNNLRPVCILLTHGHFDHTNAVNDLLKIYKDLPVYMREEDSFLLEDVFAFKIPEENKPIPEFPQISAVFTPGHTPGSICYLSNNAIFSGDTLFVGNCGRVDLPGSSPEALYESFVKLSLLNDNFIVFPGHSYGGSSSTMKEEKKFNPYLAAAVAKDKEKFLKAVI